MIRKFNQYNESIRNLLVGPTEEELLNNLEQFDPTDALFKCVRKGNGFLKGVIRSVERGADINAKDNHHGWTPITYAIENNYIDIIVYLMKKGVKIDEKTFPIEYVLTKVVYKGTLEDLKYILKSYKSILNISDTKSVMDVAYKENKVDMFDFLTDYIDDVKNFIKNYIKRI